MATTTNYSWTTPDDTALVKDGAAAIRSLGTAIDTTTKALNPSTTLGDIEYRSSTANTNTRLAIGTNGQVLTVDGGVPAWTTPASGDIEGVTAGVGISGGGTSGTVTITNSMATAIDAKGDLIVGTGADTFSRLAVGATNGHVLTVDSAEATGLKYAAVSASPASAENSITTSQTLTSQSYSDLATVGPAVTLTTGTKVLVMWAVHTNTGGSNNNCFVDFQITGATSRSANDETALVTPEYGGNENMRLTGFTRVNVTAGSNTFTLKYKQKNNTQATYKNRQIIVIDLGS
jgi:hypothetical protein